MIAPRWCKSLLDRCWNVLPLKNLLIFLVALVFKQLLVLYDLLIAHRLASSKVFWKLIKRYHGCSWLHGACWFWVLTRAGLGGGKFYPPPLANFCDISKTAARSAAKLSVPFLTSIWHVPWKFERNPSENFWEIDVLVTSCSPFSPQKRQNFKRR